MPIHTLAIRSIDGVPGMLSCRSSKQWPFILNWYVLIVKRLAPIQRLYRASAYSLRPAHQKLASWSTLIRWTTLWICAEIGKLHDHLHIRIWSAQCIGLDLFSTVSSEMEKYAINISNVLFSAFLCRADCFRNRLISVPWEQLRLIYAHLITTTVLSSQFFTQHLLKYLGRDNSIGRRVLSIYTSVAIIHKHQAQALVKPSIATAFRMENDSMTRVKINFQWISCNIVRVLHFRLDGSHKIILVREWKSIQTYGK